MDGVQVLRALLLADFNLVTLVPAERIAAGILPPGTALDAIEIKKISGNDRNIPSPGSNRHVRERIQVMALAADYPRMKRILRAVKIAAADKIGSFVGLRDVTVHTDSAGPDFVDDNASIYMSTQDFMVEFTELR